LRVKRQLEALEDYIKRIAEHRARGSIYAVERLAQLSIQALLDLGAMIAAWTKGRKPQTYREVACAQAHAKFKYYQYMKQRISK
jgi:uncharacterized protein YutE (UPF0331/DUF86 family)